MKAAKEMEKMICERCGKEFAGRTGKKFCSKKCASMASHERCGGSDNARLKQEYAIDRAQRRQERLAMKKRLAERDAAYAAAFPEQVKRTVKYFHVSGMSEFQANIYRIYK